ncbi:hypothetical protein OnM2_057032 [Erysiphe neolycopersici]|uniref:Uncharacterized protein n=1 Tax=Erysiphe neolycopersici TaxID=212602 RepID=A0A420HQL7_9PEZI|nr:hypothetical protein OnM2_057032 [Erysiphe neolycopersici]
MEPHELAIAALNQFAQNTSDREKAGSDSTNSESCNNKTDLHSKVFNSSEADGSFQEYKKKEQEDQWGIRTELHSNGSNPSSTIEECRLSTPPTSTSTSDIISSQDISSQDALSQKSHLPNSATVSEPSNHALNTPLTAGQKRTADGHMKSESPTLSTLISTRNHNRKTSSSSNVSATNSTRIEELTSGLRTRLSYAMLKVSYGWQSNSIDEVESLASQMGSPSSPSSIRKARCDYHPSSPATVIGDRQISSSNNRSAQNISRNADICCQLDQSSRTYESFWRDHFVSDNLNHRNPLNTHNRSLSSSRALAPPAEICPSSSRGSGSSKKYREMYMRTCYDSNTPAIFANPQTPQRIGSQKSSAMNHSSQTTSQEQDAIETLIYMSSPGNVNNLGHTLPRPIAQSSPQKSPLRGDAHIQSKRANGRRNGSDIEMGKSEKICGKDKIQTNISNHTIPQQDQCRNTVIKCLLEEMGESSSDDGDELVLNHGTTSTTSNHRVTAGRV